MRPHLQSLSPRPRHLAACLPSSAAARATRAASTSLRQSPRMAAAVNLTALAAQTEAALAVVWDDLGVSIDDRTSYINRIAEDVAALYHGRVASQEQLRADTEAEIASLQSTIDNMHHAMQEVAAVVSGAGGWVGLLCANRRRRQATRGETPRLHAPFPLPARNSPCRFLQPVRAGKSLLAYRDALDAYRAELQVVSAQRALWVRRRCRWRLQQKVAAYTVCPPPARAACHLSPLPPSAAVDVGRPLRGAQGARGQPAWAVRRRRLARGGESCARKGGEGQGDRGARLHDVRGDKGRRPHPRLPRAPPSPPRPTPPHHAARVRGGGRRHLHRAHRGVQDGDRPRGRHQDGARRGDRRAVRHGAGPAGRDGAGAAGRLRGGRRQAGRGERRAAWCGEKGALCWIDCMAACSQFNHPSSSALSSPPPHHLRAFLARRAWAGRRRSWTR